MDLNSIIFPAPNTEQFNNMQYYSNNLLFIPKQEGKKISHIPCFYRECSKLKNSNKYLLYFHGNAEDIFSQSYTLEAIKNTLPFNTISVEYPGYSIYNGEKSAETIEMDAIKVFDYLVFKVGISAKDILVCGRSIGSGPATYLAANRSPGGLILISPFKSIRETVKSINSLFTYVVADRFDNIERIKKVTCPIMFSHGQLDTLISFEHSVELSKQCNGPYELHLPELMTHNEFNLYEDLLIPLSQFVQRYSLYNLKDTKKLNFDDELFIVPDQLKDYDTYKKEQKKDYVTIFFRKVLNM